MNVFMSKYKLASLGHIAEGGSVAEEVIGTIRTAQAFGSQNILSKMYNVHITNSAYFEKKMAIVNGLGLAVFFFVMYARWVSHFFQGTTSLLTSFFATHQLRPGVLFRGDPAPPR